MGRPRKDIIETIATEENNFSIKQEKTTTIFDEAKILIEKEKSVEEYSKNKKPYSKTEPEISCSNEEAHRMVKKIFERKDIYKRLEILLATIGRKFGSRPIYEDFQILFSLIPYCTDNFHLMLIGDKGTGKSSMYQALTNEVCIVSEQPTASDLRGNKNLSSKDGKAILDQNIVLLDECLDYSCSEVIGLLKSYETSGKFLKYGTEEVTSHCSILKTGNNMNKIERFEDLMAKNILKGITSEWTTEAILNRQAAILYYSDIISLTRSCFAEKEDKGLNINIFLKNLEYLKTLEREINISIPKETPIRKHYIVLKAVKGLVNILYPDIIPPDYILEGLLDIVIHFCSIPDNEHYNPFKMKNLKFWLELIKPKGLKFEEGYLLKNRILLKIENKFWKIALTPFGAIENEVEISFYNNKENSEIPLAKIYPESNKLTIIQDYYKLCSTSNHFNEDGDKIYFDKEKENVIKERNNLLIKLILMAGKYGENIPEEDFYERKLYSEEKIQKIIKKFLKLNNSTYISHSCFSYDGKYEIMIINFADFVKK